MLDWLPGLDAVDVRRLDHDVDYRTVIGAALGFVIGTIFLAPAPLIRSTGAHLAGSPVGLLAVTAYKFVAVYLVILGLAHYSALDG